MTAKEMCSPITAGFRQRRLATTSLSEVIATDSQSSLNHHAPYTHRYANPVPLASSMMVAAATVAAATARSAKGL